MADLNPIQKQTVSDDPELAKVLANINTDMDGDDETPELQYEGLEQPAQDAEPEIVESAPAKATPAPVIGGVNLEEIKIHALQDLRPLVDKLAVSNEEKFNIYLLLLRSSDDNTLIEPAYNSARQIEDETNRANALLDVIKEIDYFNSRNAA